MKKKILTYLGVFLLGALLMLIVKQSNKEIIEVPVRFEVEVPVVEVQHDTIYEPKPIPYLVKKVDTSLVEEYKKANDSLKQELFKNAVTVNKYKEVFEDSIQTITVDANVTGKLNSLAVGYKTKPKSIVVDTVIPVKVPANDRSLSLYVETGIPTSLVSNNSILLNNTIILKAGLDYENKKGTIFGASFDTKKTAWIKIGKKFNF